MQYLKDDVKQNIIRSALAQFRENGYCGASMRDIAANADIVTGNIYRYFKNKEELLDSTVGSTYELMEKLKQQFRKEIVENAINFMDCGSYKILKEITLQILEIFSKHGTEMLILLDKSEGTKYADTKENLKKAVSGILHNVYLVELKKNGKEIEDDFILCVLSSSFIDGICLILRSVGDDSARIRKLIDSWLDVVFYDLHQRI
jgi:AcrR family transcriptional regulator